MLLVSGLETRTHVPSAASQTAGRSSLLLTNIFTQIWQMVFYYVILYGKLFHFYHTYTSSSLSKVFISVP
jgi:hypothetical protein